MDEGRGTKNQPAWQTIAHWHKLLLAAVLVVVMAGGVVAWQLNRNPPSIIPANTAQQFLFNVYSPTYLPSGYTVDQKSFSAQDGGVLVFQALNKAGDNIAITEEATPSNLNLTTFYSTNLTGIRNLGNLPYSTIMGTLKANQRLMVSVNTGKTWILMTSKTHFSESDVQRISHGMLQR